MWRCKGGATKGGDGCAGCVGGAGVWEARTQRGTRELRLSSRRNQLRLGLLELALHLVGGDRGGCRGCRGEGVLVRVGGRRRRLRRGTCGEQGCEVRLLRDDLLGARPVPLLHLGPHLLTGRAGGGAWGWGWRCAPPPSPSPRVCPSSSPSASCRTSASSSCSRCRSASSAARSRAPSA